MSPHAPAWRPSPTSLLRRQGPGHGRRRLARRLRLAVLTYDRIFIFERPSLSWPFFAGGVRERTYALPTGESDAESICFESPDSLLIADEATAALFRVPVSDIPVVRETPTIPAGDPASDLRIMSFNIRYAGGDRGVNSWGNRKDHVARIIAHHEPDILGVQEALADQADWLRDTVHGMGFHGVGRIDGARAGEFVPILFRADRFSLLASGHFWISPTPEIPGSRGWDAACERMASWVRLRDARTGGTLLVLNTHLDHQGKEARRQGLALLRDRLPALADGASVILLGDFNTGAAGDAAAVLMGDAPPPGAPRLVDTHRAATRTRRGRSHLLRMGCADHGRPHRLDYRIRRPRADRRGDRTLDARRQNPLRPLPGGGAPAPPSCTTLNAPC